LHCDLHACEPGHNLSYRGTHNQHRALRSTRLAQDPQEYSGQAGYSQSAPPEGYRTVKGTQDRQERTIRDQQGILRKYLTHVPHTKSVKDWFLIYEFYPVSGKFLPDIQNVKLLLFSNAKIPSTFRMKCFGK
jgi:hypothetical protein